MIEVEESLKRRRDKKEGVVDDVKYETEKKSRMKIK
jgi:hypothetical protein